MHVVVGVVHRRLLGVVSLVGFRDVEQRTENRCPHPLTHNLLQSLVVAADIAANGRREGDPANKGTVWRCRCRRQPLELLSPRRYIMTSHRHHQHHENRPPRQTAQANSRNNLIESFSALEGASMEYSGRWLWGARGVASVFLATGPHRLVLGHVSRAPTYFLTNRGRWCRQA